MRNCEGSSKLERKAVEKNRRLQMKSLSLKLSSLIPQEFYATSSKDASTQEDHIDRAAVYIEKLKKRVESLKHRKHKMSTEAVDKQGIGSEIIKGSELPMIEVRTMMDSNLEVILISELDRRSMFHQAIVVLEEEGAEVVSANFSAVGDKLYYTIHAQAISLEKGFEASRILERLKKLGNLRNCQAEK